MKHKLSVPCSSLLGQSRNTSPRTAFTVRKLWHSVHCFSQSFHCQLIPSPQIPLTLTSPSVPSPRRRQLPPLLVVHPLFWQWAAGRRGWGCPPSAHISVGQSTRWFHWLEKFPALKADMALNLTIVQPSITSKDLLHESLKFLFCLVQVTWLNEFHCDLLLWNTSLSPKTQSTSVSLQLLTVNTLLSPKFPCISLNLTTAKLST